MIANAPWQMVESRPLRGLASESQSFSPSENGLLVRGNAESGAMFSADERYRYLLWRVWDPSRLAVIWLLLNPSTADENKLDPTLTRCRKFSERWGLGQMVVWNLFAYRATDPADMKAQKEPTGGPNNIEVLLAAGNLFPISLVMLGWGVNGAHNNRDQEVLDLLKDTPLSCLQRTRSGAPVHPLYVRSDKYPMRYER